MSAPKVHDLNVLDALKSGRLALDMRPPDPTGALHASSVPAVFGTGDNAVSYGKCGRLAYLRWLGHDMPAEFDRLLMFSLGHMNEERTAAELAKAGVAFLREDEHGCAISWSEAGARVTGRPDFLLLGEGRGPARRPVQGLELKACCSVHTATKVNFDLRPTSDHLVQAGHYSAQHGYLPWSIIYTSSVDWHISQLPPHVRKKFTPGAPGVEFKGNTPFKIRPFEREYRLGWTEPSERGQLIYWTEGLARPTVTRLTFAAIRAGVRAIVAQEHTMAPRPASNSIDGADSYNPCNYCPLKDVCDQHEHNVDHWLAAAVDEAAAQRQLHRPE